METAATSKKRKARKKKLVYPDFLSRSLEGFALDEMDDEAMRMYDDIDPTGLSSTAYKRAAMFTYQFIAPNATNYENAGLFMHQIWPLLGKEGYFRQTVRVEDGGDGLPYATMGAMFEAISRKSPGTGLSVLANVALCQHVIATNASKEQKTKYLTPLMNGEKHGAICITEPNHGSDARGIQLKAVKGTKNGKKGYYLTGTKTFITNGGTAETLVVYANTSSSKKAEQKKKDEEEGRHLSAFIVNKDKDCKTVTSNLIKKGGMRSSETWEMHFTRHFVPEEDMMKEEGDGWGILKGGLAFEREMLAMQSVGLAEEAYQRVVDYLKIRTQFKKPIIDFQAAKLQLAETYRKLDTIRIVACSKLGRADKGKGIADRELRYSFMQNKDGFVSKNTAGKIGSEIVEDCIVLYGGMGFTEEIGLMGLKNDAILNRIGGGTDTVCNLASWPDLGYSVKGKMKPYTPIDPLG